MKYAIPHQPVLELNTLVLDLNGTLSVRGKIAARVPSLLKALKKKGFRIILLTGDQRGTASALSQKLGIECIVAKNSAVKEKVMKALGSKTSVAIGNARIDIGTFKHAALSIATLQAEGIHTGILKYVDILVPSIENALELLLDANSLCATMKK